MNPDQPFYRETGIHQGQVEDPNHARSLAEVEEQSGHRARRAHEKLLKSTHEAGGFTPDQQENIKLMKGLKEKYPDAFIEGVDTGGRRYLLTRAVSSGSAHAARSSGHSIENRQLFTTYGFVDITSNRPAVDNLLAPELDEADFTEVIDYLESDRPPFDLTNFDIPIGDPTQAERAPVSKRYVLTHYTRGGITKGSVRAENLSRTLNTANKESQAVMKREAASTDLASADSVLSGL
jgi:hypothetical protein